MLSVSDAFVDILSVGEHAPGYISLGFPDPRQITPTPSTSPAPAAGPADTLAHGTVPPGDATPDMTDRL